MKIIYLGTTTIIFDDGVSQIQFDAHVTRPAISNVIFHKLDSDEQLVERVIKEKSINQLKAIFISHSHHDHVLDVAAFAKNTGASVYGSASSLNVARGGGIKETALHCFKPEDIYKIDQYSVRVLKSIHSTAHFYNNNLGQIIEKPLIFPARIGKFKEGGSFDFLVQNKHCSYLIRPSFNYLPHQLDCVQADVLFLGIGGLSKATAETVREFFKETIDKVKPELVIPIHWDNFFSPLYGTLKRRPVLTGDWKKSLDIADRYCEKNHIEFKVVRPLEEITL